METPSIEQIEAMCRALFESPDQTQRTEAQAQLLTLQSSVDLIPQCQFILNNSDLHYAQTVACSSLETLITQFWNTFTLEQKLELRNFLLTYLATRIPGLQDFVVTNLSKVCCRITKLGWFDCPELREIVVEASKFFEASVDHKIVGLRLLNSLVDEMNTPTSGRTLTLHRKVAVSFRDNALFQVFQIAIEALRTLRDGAMGPVSAPQQSSIGQLALSLANSCLSFDFIGTNPEESAEDVNTVQVPTSWRPVVQDTSTMQIFFDYYMNTDPPRSNKALQALVQLSSVRRSLFPSERERTAFLQALMKGIHDIMITSTGLDHEENYHEFCRLLGRLKASYQLSELVKIPGFMDWLQQACDFTKKSLQNWQVSMNSIHYLLALWSRLVQALPYLRSESTDTQRQAQLLRQCVLQVVEAYIGTMLESVDIVVQSDGEIEDPLEDEGSLREQMDRLPGIARLQYDTVAQFLLQQFQTALLMYQQVLSSQPTSNAQLQLNILEGRFTWLTYMVGAVIGAGTASDPKKGPEELMWDGGLSKCVFELVEYLDLRMNSSGGQSRCDKKLEIAILHFFRSFKKVFMMDGLTSMSPTYLPHIPGGSPAHPLLSLALSGGRAPEEAESEVRTVYDVMSLGDVTIVMNRVIDKICNNIKYWHRSDAILEETLDVFVDLVSSYSSSKTLLSLATVDFLVRNHVGDHFPFLGYNSDNKYRITFYSALSRLVFSSSEDLNNFFDIFIAPNLEILGRLSAAPDLRDGMVKVAIVGALRDLRGITVSTYNKRTYNLLFEALYPQFFPLFNRIAEAWYDDTVVMTALLKFLQEFVLNKSQRITFEQSSANGILLFRETSQIICSYGSQIIHVPVERDVYLEKYKGIRLMLNTLTAALSGNYVNFGVFALYGDKALENALHVSLQTCLQIPIEEVISYVKLSKAYFGFLEVLFKNHLELMCQLHSDTFIGLLKNNLEGLQSTEVSVCTVCASTIDHLATYIFLNQTRDRPTMRSIRLHVEANPEILGELMSALFNSLLFGTQANQWAVTRPILSLLLAAEQSFLDYQAALIASQSPENAEKLRGEFERLTVDIQRSVETTNRDKFTQKLTVFRLNVRQFLDSAGLI